VHVTVTAHEKSLINTTWRPKPHKLRHLPRHHATTAFTAPAIVCNQLDIADHVRTTEPA